MLRFIGILAGLIVLLYNNWIFDIFYSGKHELLTIKLKTLFESPRILFLTINSIIIFYLHFFYNNEKTKNFIF